MSLKRWLHGANNNSDGYIYMEYVNRFLLHDARNLDQVLSPDTPSVSTVITSPPYWKLKDYGVKTQIGYGQAKQEYLDDISKVFRHCYNATKPDGSMWIVVDDYRENGTLQLLPWEFTVGAQSAGWSLREIIIWDKQHTLPWHVKGQMRNVLEYILFFSKTANYKFYVDRLKDWGELSRWWVDFPERFNPRGKTPTNIWSIPIRTQGTWRRMSEMNHHCPFPVELVARIIELTTDPGDLVMDPFAGSGVVLAQAEAMERAYLGFDVNSLFIDMFNKSIKREVAEEWKKLSLVRSNLDRDAVDFEKTIMKLRALKFARQATKPFIELAKRQPELTPIAILCVASLPSRYERKQHFDVDVYIVVDKPKVRFEAELSTTNDRVSSKPLTLYEIKPRIELITVSQLLKKSNITNKRFYIYTDYKPRKHSGVNLLQNWFEGNNLSKAAVKPKIPMLANIAVDVAWAID